MPTVEGRATPLGVLFSLLAATIFLGTGGPAHVVGALASSPPELGDGVTRAAADIAAGIGIAVAMAAPLLAASIIVEIAGALVARAASPAQLHAFLAPIRSLALLMLTALLLEPHGGVHGDPGAAVTRLANPGAPEGRGIRTARSLVRSGKSLVQKQDGSVSSDARHAAPLLRRLPHAPLGVLHARRRARAVRASRLARLLFAAELLPGDRARA